MPASLNVIVAASIAALLPSFHAPRLIWNATASMPVGLYLRIPAGTLARNALVIVMPSFQVAQFAAKRGYLPLRVPLLKHVAAAAGDTVCNYQGSITIDGKGVARALSQDSRGRPMPRWQGCVTLGFGTVFLLNPTVPTSFDSRYFGPVPTQSIIGIAVPLWTH
jgi:conjugative transfer signal peptidase TraF